MPEMAWTVRVSEERRGREQGGFYHRVIRVFSVHGVLQVDVDEATRLILQQAF
jgi:hypothetical protein